MYSARYLTYADCFSCIDFAPLHFSCIGYVYVFAKKLQRTGILQYDSFGDGCLVSWGSC